MLKFSLKSEIVYFATEEVLKLLAQIKSFLDCEGTSCLLISLSAEGDILMLCQAGCRHCNSNFWIRKILSLARIWTPNLCDTSLTRYQLSYPDWILDILFYIANFVKINLKMSTFYFCSNFFFFVGVLWWNYQTDSFICSKYFYQFFEQHVCSTQCWNYFSFVGTNVWNIEQILVDNLKMWPNCRSFFI